MYKFYILNKTICIFNIILTLTLLGCTNLNLPKISKGEFSFRIEYEINGEIKILEDTMICEYYIQRDEGVGKSLMLKHEWLKDKNKYYVHTLCGLDDDTIIQYISPSANFWMGEDVENYDITIPNIDIVNTKTWERHRLITSELKEFGLNIINYECDPPIKNSFQ
ncbi:MAG: hypothetical protein J6L59_04985 [Clostridia bacterium]|nr:hypothetical protein [Clostridia bacterium]